MRSELPRVNRVDLAILAGLSMLACGYCWDAVQASTDTRNLILILPVTVLVLLLCAAEFVSQLKQKSTAEIEKEPITSAAIVIVLFAFFVVTLPWLGFDVGTLLFLAAYLKLHGENRWRWIMGYSLCISSFLALFFSSMLPYPMPMLLFPTDY